MNKISSNDIQNHLQNLNGWEKVDGRDAITKSFQFKDFKHAWVFMSDIAIYAEEINHHPEWFNVYNIVKVTLSTHDVGGLSDLDIKMAQKMNEQMDCLTT